MCLIQILKWFSLKNGMVVLGLVTSHHDSTIAGTHSNLDGSLLAHARAEKEATIEGLLLFRSSTHTHTHTLPQQGLFGRPQAVVVLMPYVGGEVGSAGSDWKVGGYESSLRWLQSCKLLRKHGRLMSKGLKPATWQSAGTPLEAPDRNSQSPEGAVQRTYSSARGIHVTRPRRGGEWRPRNMMGGKCPLWVHK